MLRRVLYNRASFKVRARTRRRLVEIKGRVHAGAKREVEHVLF
jgi:hypothetical protein